MKILYIHQHFVLPSAGGGIRSYAFAKKLIERGHEVTMVCGRPNTKNSDKRNRRFISKRNVEGINVIECNVSYSNKKSFAKRISAFLVFIIGSSKVSLTEKYDILFATSTPLTVGVPALLAKWIRRKKYVFEVRDLWPELPEAMGIVRNPYALKFLYAFEKKIYKNATSCIGLAPGIIESIKRKTNDKPTFFLPNSCDLDIFSLKSTESKIVLPSTIADNKFRLIFSGAHGLANGLDAVLDMAKVLLDRKALNIEILLVGDGMMKVHLVSRAASESISNIKFISSVSKTELSNIFQTVDVGLMILKNIPSFYNGTSPNKFFDYISAGLPVITNYPGWIAELIESSNCGVVVEPCQHDVFADAVIKLSEDSYLLKEYSRNSLKLAQEYSREKIANAFVDVIEAVETDFENIECSN